MPIVQNFLQYKTDNVIEVSGLQDAITGVFYNSATITVTLIDKASGLALTGQTWPLTLGYVASSSGIYRGTLVNGLNVASGQQVVAQLTANAGSGLIRYWELPVLVEIANS